MAMNATTLGNAMATALSVTDPAAKAAMIAVAGAIISHFQNFAEVSVTTSDSITTLQLATTICAAPGSPVTGTISTTGTGSGTIA